MKRSIALEIFTRLTGLVVLLVSTLQSGPPNTTLIFGGAVLVFLPVAGRDQRSAPSQPTKDMRAHYRVVDFL